MVTVGHPTDKAQKKLSWLGRTLGCAGARQNISVVMVILVLSLDWEGICTPFKLLRKHRTDGVAVIAVVVAHFLAARIEVQEVRIVVATRIRGPVAAADADIVDVRFEGVAKATAGRRETNSCM